VQKKRSLRAEFCSSRVAKEGSGIFWIMIELLVLYRISRDVGETPTHPRN